MLNAPAAAAAREPALAELIDPAALEQRLAGARARRAVALARRAGLRRAPAASGVAGKAPAFVAGLAAGLAVAAFAALLPRGPQPPEAWVDLAGAALPAAAAPPALGGPLAPAHTPPPGELAPLAPAPPTDRLASLRPAPRPADLALATPAARHATRSARNRPAAPGFGQALGELNRATIGAAAGALGVRERLVLPGLTLSLDHRGFRLRAHPARGKRRGR